MNTTGLLPPVQRRHRPALGGQRRRRMGAHVRQPDVRAGEERGAHGAAGSAFERPRHDQPFPQRPALRVNAFRVNAFRVNALRVKSVKLFSCTRGVLVVS